MENYNCMGLNKGLVHTLKKSFQRNMKFVQNTVMASTLTLLTLVNLITAKLNQLHRKINQPSKPQIKAGAKMENSPFKNLRIITKEKNHSSTKKSQNFSIALGYSWNIV